MKSLTLSLGALLPMALLLALSSCPAAADTLYQWRDEQGKLVVSDRPPQDLTIPYEEIETGNRISSGGVFRSPGSDDREEPAPILEPDGEVDLPPFKKDPEVCAAARRNLEFLNTAPRVRMRNAAGEYVYLTEDERREQREEARRIVMINCE